MHMNPNFEIRIIKFNFNYVIELQILCIIYQIDGESMYYNMESSNHTNKVMYKNSYFYPQ